MDPNQQPEQPEQPEINQAAAPVSPQVQVPITTPEEVTPIPVQIPVQEPVQAPTMQAPQPVEQPAESIPPAQTAQPTVIEPQVIQPIIVPMQQDTTVTPQVIGLQTEQPVTQNPVSTDNSDMSQKKPGLVLGIIAVVLSFIVGLIGAIVGVVALIKGVKSGRKGLTILGGLAIFIGLSVTVFALLVVVPLINKLSYSGKTLSYTSSKCEKGKFSFVYPEELNKKTTDVGDSVELRQLFNESKGTNNQNSMAVINAECAYIGSEYLTNSEAIASFEEELPAALDEFVKDAKNYGFSISNPSAFKPYTTSNIIGKAWSSDVSGTYNDQKMYGKIIVAIGKDDIYSYTVYAIDDVWDANKSVWDKSIKSLTVE